MSPTSGSLQVVAKTCGCCTPRGPACGAEPPLSPPAAEAEVGTPAAPLPPPPATGATTASFSLAP
eukprot:13028110-Alexandrium_andersonii.AAC.1